MEILERYIPQKSPTRAGKDLLSPPFPTAVPELLIEEPCLKNYDVYRHLFPLWIAAPCPDDQENALSLPKDIILIFLPALVCGFGSFPFLVLHLG